MNMSLQYITNYKTPNHQEVIRMNTYFKVMNTIKFVVIALVAIGLVAAVISYYTNVAA